MFYIKNETKTQVESRKQLRYLSNQEISYTVHRQYQPSRNMWNVLKNAINHFHLKNQDQSIYPHCLDINSFPFVQVKRQHLRTFTNSVENTVEMQIYFPSCWSMYDNIQGTTLQFLSINFVIFFPLFQNNPKFAHVSKCSCFLIFFKLPTIQVLFLRHLLNRRFPFQFPQRSFWRFCSFFISFFCNVNSRRSICTERVQVHTYSFTLTQPF